MKIVKLLFVLTIIISLASCSQENEEIYVSKITEPKSNYSKMEYEILNLVKLIQFHEEMIFIHVPASRKTKNVNMLKRQVQAQNLP